MTAPVLTAYGWLLANDRSEMLVMVCGNHAWSRPLGAGVSGNPFPLPTVPLSKFATNRAEALEHAKAETDRLAYANYHPVTDPLPVFVDPAEYLDRSNRGRLEYRTCTAWIDAHHPEREGCVP